MKAAVLNTAPAPLEIEDIDIDTPGPHEVLVRTAAAGVCHSDLHFSDRARSSIRCRPCSATNRQAWWRRSVPM
jgi:Zn-dependent alcohol dehydrogenase